MKSPLGTWQLSKSVDLIRCFPKIIQNLQNLQTPKRQNDDQRWSAEQDGVGRDDRIHGHGCYREWLIWIKFNWISIPSAQIGDTRIPCHKGTVCRYSSIINMAMKSNMKEGVTGEFTVTVEDVTEDDVCFSWLIPCFQVRQFLLAMYNPWDPATMEPHVLGIYRLACVYQSVRVKDMAVQVLVRLLDHTVKKTYCCEIESVTEATIELKIDNFKAFAADSQSPSRWSIPVLVWTYLSQYSNA